MLVICEDCSKKYNIDESKMKGARAQFSCQQCGHIIVVVRDQVTSTPAEERPEPYPGDGRRNGPD